MSGDPKEGNRALLKVAAVFCLIAGVIQAIAQVVALLLINRVIAKRTSALVVFHQRNEHVLWREQRRHLINERIS